MNNVDPQTGLPFVASAVIHGGTIADASTKVSFSAPLRVATKHAGTLTCLLVSDQIVTVYLRRYGASRIVTLDDTGTVLAANTPIAIVLAGTTAGNGAGVGLGDEAELIVSNASGALATITAQLLAR